MLNDLEEAKHRFRHLVDTNANHHDILDVLVPLTIKTDLIPDDKGWGLWNICDRLAMLRDARNQYRYQSAFYEWSKDHLPPTRLHWVVSDGTQACTLIDGGFLEPWWSWYAYANERSPQVAANRGVRFESHRANAAAYTRFSQLTRAEYALEALEDLLTEDATWPSLDFATVTLSTLKINYCGMWGQTDELTAEADRLVRELDAWLENTRSTAVSSIPDPLLGSWEQLNAPWPPIKVYTATHNAALALTETGQYEQAEHLFRAHARTGAELTAYGRSQFALACWENRHDRDETRALLLEPKVIPLDKLKLWAPSLCEVLAGAPRSDGNRIACG